MSVESVSSWDRRNSRICAIVTSFFSKGPAILERSPMRPIPGWSSPQGLSPLSLALAEMILEPRNICDKVLYAPVASAAHRGVIGLAGFVKLRAAASSRNA